MPTEESLPMYLILLKKRRQHILFLLIFVCLLVFWVNFHLSRHLNERVPNCNIPCIGTTCINCLTEEREEKIPRIDILEKLKLKQAFRVRKLPPRGDTDASDQICKRPNFDAKHDSIKYAFHSMERLNCTGESLFKVENAVFKLDRNVLKGRELERCDYYGIVRITDDYSSYSEPLTKNAEPFDLLIKEDFVRIKCFLKKAEDDNEIKSGRKNRKLLQLSLDHFQKDVNPIALRLAKTLWSFDQSMSNRVNTSKDLQNLREIQQLIKAAYYKSNKVSFNEAKVPVKRQNYKLLLDELQTKIQNGKGAEIDTKGKYLQLKSNRRLKGVDEMVNDENYQLLVDEIGTLIQNSKRADYDIESKHSQWKSSRRLQEEDEMVNDENYQLLVDEIRALIEKSKRADYEIESKHTQLKPNRRLQEVDKVVNNEGDPEDDNKELIINDKEIEGYIEAPGNESDPIFDYAMYADQLEEEPADFDQFIVQVYPKEGVHRRILKQMRELNAERKHLRELSMNVLIFGLDSMSHMSYQRKLPKTYLFLRDKLRAVILHGYNIVGDATTAALLPMLTGKAETELPEARKKHILADYVDRFPLIWNDFRDHGYVTMFAEDEPTIGAFNLRLSGFDNQPTDHYMRPFWTSLWESDLRLSRPRFCTGNVPNHMFLLNYTRSFFDSYKNVSKFAFVFGSELTHWNNNPGEYMDGDFVEFLKYFQSQGHLKNTLLILMSDHGARYSAVRKTVQGKLEERLPMMSFVFPDWFRDKFPNLYNNLVKNSDRLSTPFDIYETLKHVLDIHNMSGNVNGMLNKRKIPRGLSLLQPIPRNRTCTMAEIQMHWCTCLKQVELHSRDLHVMKAVDSLVKRINNETKFVRDQCVELHFKRVHSAFLLIPNEQVLMFQKTKDEDNRVANFNSSISVDHAHFQITIETLPNHGMFEATVQVNMTAGSYLVMDGISRLDMYGNQPACVQDKHPDLRKYCYCKNTAQ